MKKFFAFFLVLLLLSNTCAFAETEQYDIIEETYLAQSYTESTVQLFSAGPTLEETLVEGWTNLDAKIDIREYNIPTSEFSGIYKEIVANNPHIYYITNGCRISYIVSTGTVAEVLPNYTETDKTVIKSNLDAIDNATEDILLLIDDDMSDFEKIMTVHDYMVLNYEYDYTYSNYGILIMTTKTGVCMAYSYAFKHLMNKLGIECRYISSNAMNHGWNLVKLNGNWYHIDLTWDDASQKKSSTYIDRPSQVNHTYALLSDDKIQNLDDPHYGYDTNSVSADSDFYDSASWHDGIGSIVTIDGTEYWAANDKIISSGGDTICNDLNGSNNRWDVGSKKYLSGMYAGLAEHNGMLYYNTDTAIKSYNPKTKETKSLKSVTALCGLYIEHNTLKYCVYNRSSQIFTEGGTIDLGGTRVGGVTHQNGKAEVRIYKDNNEELIVYSFGENTPQMAKITDKGLATITFDSKENQTFFFWNENMQPLADKKVIH